MSTRAQILAEIAAQFPDNTSGAITPAKLRQVVEDIANSYNNSTDEPAAASTNAHNLSPSAHESGLASVNLVQIPHPNAVIATAGAAGNLTGSYDYEITFVTDIGETQGSGRTSNLLTVSGKRIVVSGIGVSSDSRVIARRLYRNKTTASDVVNKQLVATIPDNTTTEYEDNIPDDELGVLIPRVSTVGGGIYLNSERAGVSDSQVTAFGVGAMASNTGYANSTFGAGSLASNTTGSRNNSFGIYSLSANTTGFNNSGFGTHALGSNTSGYSNSCLGESVMLDNTTGYQNSAVGSGALMANTSGINNVAVGHNASNASTTALGVVAVGQSALPVSNGNFNVAVGLQALKNTTTGGTNVAIGLQAGSSNTTGNSNVAVGGNALNSCSTGGYNVAIGDHAGYYETGWNTLYIDIKQRANAADARAKAMMYGLFSDDPATQILKINAAVTVGTLSIGGVLLTVAYGANDSAGAGYRTVSFKAANI